MTFKPEILGDKLIFSYDTYGNIGHYEKDCIFDISNGIKIVEERGVRGGHISWYIESNGKKENFGRKNKELMNDILDLFKDRSDLKYIIIPDVPNPGY